MHIAPRLRTLARKLSPFSIDIRNMQIGSISSSMPDSSTSNSSWVVSCDLMPELASTYLSDDVLLIGRLRTKY